jgi:hypothetical protein
MELRSNNKKLLTIKTIAMASGESEKTVESFLYNENRYPSMFYLYCVYQIVNKSNGNMNHDLKKIIWSFEKRWRKFYNRSGYKKKQYPPRKQLMFVYNGNKLTIKQISEKTELPERDIRNRITYRKISNNSDVSNLIKKMIHNKK